MLKSIIQFQRGGLITWVTANLAIGEASCTREEQSWDVPTPSTRAGGLTKCDIKPWKRPQRVIKKNRISRIPSGWNRSEKSRNNPDSPIKLKYDILLQWNAQDLGRTTQLWESRGWSTKITGIIAIINVSLITGKIWSISSRVFISQVIEFEDSGVWIVNRWA